jgi:maleate isomerase
MLFEATGAKNYLSKIVYVKFSKKGANHLDRTRRAFYKRINSAFTRESKRSFSMTDYVKKFMPRFRYGVIQPRAHEDIQRGRSYQLYRLLPLDFMEISTGLGLENYTEEGVEKAIKNYWTCVDRLAKEKVDHIIFSGAPISAVLTRPRVIELLRQTKERTGISADAPLEALIAALKHLGLNKLAIGSRWADPVNNAIIRYLEADGIKVVGITKRNQWASDSFAMTLEQGLEMALDVGREAAKTWPEAEGISVPGGAAMSLHVIPALEEEFGKPAFTNMSAEVWNDLVRPGIIPPVQGWGRLLAGSSR